MSSLLWAPTTRIHSNPFNSCQILSVTSSRGSHLTQKKNILTTVSMVHHRLANSPSYTSLISLWPHADEVPGIADKMMSWESCIDIFLKPRALSLQTSKMIHSLACFMDLLKCHLLSEDYLDTVLKIRMHSSISHPLLCLSHFWQHSSSFNML